MSGKNYYLPFLPATPSSPSRALEGLFELTQRPSRALVSPLALLLELLRYKDTVRCPGAQRPQDTDLDYAFVENAFFTLILDCEKSTERIQLVTRPDGR